MYCVVCVHVLCCVCYACVCVCIVLCVLEFLDGLKFDLNMSIFLSSNTLMLLTGGLSCMNTHSNVMHVKVYKMLQLTTASSTHTTAVYAALL